jgi:predicted metal-binding protein
MKTRSAERKSSKKLSAYVDRALALGIRHAVLIDTSTIATGEWVRLKCQFGCGGYGSCLTCPPYAPAPSRTAKVLSEYRHALLLQMKDLSPKESSSAWKKLKRAAVTLEKEIFLDNHPKALALTAGPCPYCRTCHLEEGCAHPDLARPSVEACGIDVYSTAHNNGIALDVVQDTDSTCSYIALVLID